MQKKIETRPMYQKPYTQCRERDRGRGPVGKTSSGTVVMQSLARTDASLID